MISRASSGQQITGVDDASFSLSTHPDGAFANRTCLELCRVPDVPASREASAFNAERHELLVPVTEGVPPVPLRQTAGSWVEDTPSCIEIVSDAQATSSNVAKTFQAGQEREERCSEPVAVDDRFNVQPDAVLPHARLPASKLGSGRVLLGRVCRLHQPVG